MLEAEGHTVIAPDLPGMGGTDEELTAATLANWANYVSELCISAEKPVILCGHSRGGLVLSETAERIPNEITALVYICAMMLPSGMSREQWRDRAEPNPDLGQSYSPIHQALPRSLIAPTQHLCSRSFLRPIWLRRLLTASWPSLTNPG
jgi:pimeloyl-ACP methyl ester carboxylesterase